MSMWVRPSMYACVQKIDELKKGTFAKLILTLIVLLFIPCMAPWFQTAFFCMCIYVSLSVSRFFFLHATFFGHLLFCIKFSMCIVCCRIQRKRERVTFDRVIQKVRFDQLTNEFPLNGEQKVQCKTTCFNKIYEMFSFFHSFAIQYNEQRVVAHKHNEKSSIEIVLYLLPHFVQMKMYERRRKKRGTLLFIHYCVPCRSQLRIAI